MGRKTKLILSGVLAVCLMGCIVAGGLYWYDQNVDRSGWVEKDGIRFYRDFHADPASGWLNLAQGTYYLQEGGIPVTGWQEIEGRRYHFDPGGAMTTGWMDEGSKTYFFDGDGTLTTGWAVLDGSTHYFDEAGVLFSGWLDWDGSTYYLPQGILVTGWQEIEGQTYCFDPSGRLLTGWAEVDGAEYCFQPSGILLTDWQETEAGRLYYQSNGTPLTGWQELEGKRYLFDENGIAVTGWFYEGEYRWYFQEDGSAAVGPVEVDGIMRYFTPKGREILLVNARNPIPEDYSPDLVEINARHRVAYPCYEALMQMLADCKAEGIGYDFNSSYRTQAVQTAIMEEYTADYMKYRHLTFEEARAQVLEFVAYPGTSEHQLGLAVDLLGDNAAPWLNEHCWDYGFIRRYTKEKEDITGIVSEPWHFRYVGKEVALDIKESGLCLEEYLGAGSVKE